MRVNGWRRLGIVGLGAWWAFWIMMFFGFRADRDEAISIDQVVSGEKWTAATYNPVVSWAQVGMNRALLAMLAPVVLFLAFFAIRWVIAGFRKPAA